MAKISNLTLPNGNDYDIRATAIPYGEVDSTSTSTAFTVTVPGITELTNGTLCYIRNNVITSAANCTLNVNGLGAKPIYSSLAAASRSTTIFNINYTMMFIYNENRVSDGCWDVFYGYDSNTNTIGYQVRTYGLSLPMSSVTYRYRLLFTSADGTKFVPANNSTSTNATASRTTNQEKIDPFGKIVYYGTTASVAAGSRPSASYLWEQYAPITLGYSFNRTGAALVLTLWKPLYLKCVPQSDGSAIIDADTPYVQTLPSTEDGKIYIFLGIVYTETQFELTLEHPIYEYKDGCIRQWSNEYQDTMVVNVSNIDTTYDTWTGISDKPILEVYNAAESGKNITLRATFIGGESISVPLSKYWKQYVAADDAYDYHVQFIYQDQHNRTPLAYATINLYGYASSTYVSFIPYPAYSIVSALVNTDTESTTFTIDGSNYPIYERVGHLNVIGTPGTGYTTNAYNAVRLMNNTVMSTSNDYVAALRIYSSANSYVIDEIAYITSMEPVSGTTGYVEAISQTKDGSFHRYELYFDITDEDNPSVTVTRNNVSFPIEVVNEPSSTTTITLQTDKFYIFPQMSTLSVTVSATGMYMFRFTSGSTATTLTITGAVMPDSFVVDTNKVYEINIYQGYGVVSSWTTV